MTRPRSRWAGLVPAVASEPASRPPARQQPREPTVRTAGDLDDALSQAARRIKQLLDTRRETSIAVGHFTGPANFPSSAGPGIVKGLSEALQKLGVTVKPRANLGISGTYRCVEEKHPGPPARPVPAGAGKGPLALHLKIRVEDDSGTVLVELEQKIVREETISMVLGLTFQARMGQEYHATQDGLLRESLTQPRSYIAGTRALAGPDSPFAVEVLVRRPGERSYEPRAPRDEDGLAFVPIERGEVYAVRLINQADHDAAVSLTIDRLSMFAFSEKRGAQQVIVPPRSSSTIVGWHRTDRESNEFQVTEYARGAVALLQASPEQVGTITATFAAAWKPGDRPPAGEPVVLAKPDLPPPAAEPGEATGVGHRVESRFARVQRQIGVLRAVVSVRYTR
jgi:hypothetical protein